MNGRSRVFLDTNIIVYLYSEDESIKREIAYEAVERSEDMSHGQTINSRLLIINPFRS
jgi:predicted nucleic acid-binding protein